MAETGDHGTVAVLDAISKISKQMVGPYEAEDLYARVVETIATLTNAEACSLWLIESDKKVKVKAGTGYHHHLLAEATPNPHKRAIPAEYELNEGVTGTIAAGNRVFRTEGGAAHKDSHREWMGKYDEVQWPQGGKCVSFIGVPLMLPSETIGVLKVENKKEGDRRVESFSEQDEILLSILANVIAMTIENHRISAIERRTVQRVFQLNLNALAHRARGLLSACKSEFNRQRPLLLELDNVGGHLAAATREELAHLLAQSEETIHALGGLYSLYERWFGESDRGASVRPDDLFDAAVADTEELISVIGGKAKIPHVQRATPGSSPTVWMRGSILRYVLHELIYNSAKAGASVLQFSVTEATESTAVVEVADDGPGLPDERLQAFERGEVVPSQEGRGQKGLGLVLCKRLIQEEGGAMRIAEHEPGADAVMPGVHFILELPRCSH